MELFTLLLFCLTLMGCVLGGISIIYALLIGLAIFCAYGRIKHHTWSQLATMAFSGVKTVRNVLIVFTLIGMLTAVWRAAGTIPTIVCYAARLIHPSIFILMVFLLNCGVSVLMGTAFGTAATMGVICMTMATAMGISPLLVGGAVLSGIYFGDRCSPVSTSALLVCELTDTDLFTNLRAMFRSALVPFLLSCALYMLMGLTTHGTGGGTEIQALFAQTFDLHWVTLLPAVVMLVLSFLKVQVKVTMLVSILTAALLCLTIQHTALPDLLRLLVLGYQTSDPALAGMLNGGGIISMLKVMAIICISSTYAGIFKGTGLLDGVREKIVQSSSRLTPFGSIVCTSIITAMVACNHVLTIMLTHQLCTGLEQEKELFALDLENSAVVIAPLIPWSVAAAVPISTISAPVSCLFAACFLYLLPTWSLIKRVLSTKAVTQ